MRFVEVCSGTGGFALAAAWCGWDVVGLVEIDPYCQRVLRRHFPRATVMGDIREVRGDEFGPIDVLAGGIPCQPFSVAGKQRGQDDDRHLWPDVRRIVEVARPTWVCVENVDGFVRLALDDLAADLEALGYEVGAGLVPAGGVGALHLRNRVWITARLPDADRREL